MYHSSLSSCSSSSPSRVACESRRLGGPRHLGTAVINGNSHFSGSFLVASLDGHEPVAIDFSLLFHCLSIPFFVLTLLSRRDVLESVCGKRNETMDARVVSTKRQILIRVRVCDVRVFTGNTQCCKIKIRFVHHNHLVNLLI